MAITLSRIEIRVRGQITRQPKVFIYSIIAPHTVFLKTVTLSFFFSQHFFQKIKQM